MMRRAVCLLFACWWAGLCGCQSRHQAPPVEYDPEDVQRLEHYLQHMKWD